MLLTGRGLNKKRRPRLANLLQSKFRSRRKSRLTLLQTLTHVLALSRRGLAQQVRSLQAKMRMPSRSIFLMRISLLRTTRDLSRLTSGGSRALTKRLLTSFPSLVVTPMRNPSSMNDNSTEYDLQFQH